MKLLVPILVLITITALGGSLGLLNGQPLPIAPELQKLDPTLTIRILQILSFLYAVSALLATYSAWRRSHWALRAYALFAASLSAFVLFLLYIAPVPKDAFFFIAGPIFFGLVGWGLWKGQSVLSTELKRMQRVA